MIHVAVGVIFNAHREILIAKRPPGKSKEGFWEFPGGKLEQDETPFQALERELEEELGITHLSATPWLQITHDYSDRVIFLDVWQVTQFSGQPQGMEGQPLLWVLPQELFQFEFPAGNRLILEKISEISERGADSKRR